MTTDLQDMHAVSVLTVQLSIQLSAFQLSVWFTCWEDILAFLVQYGFDPNQDIHMTQDMFSEHYTFTQQKDML